MLDAPRANEQIDRLANGNSDAAQAAKVSCCRDGDRIAGYGDDGEAAQKRFDFQRMPLVGHTLQDLTKHQVSDGDLFNVENAPQASHMRQIPAAEKINPNA